MAATMKDIARETGLGLATISSYFNGGNVREKNRIKIEAAIKELHYEVNEVARGLKTNATKAIGVVIPELNNVFCSEIITEMEDILRNHGYATIVCDCRTDEKLEKEAVDFLMRKRVDGLINMPVDITGSHLREFQETKRLGADAVINTTKENYMEEAMALTEGKGYGFVYETAGQVPTMHMAFELAGNKAHVCFIGTPHVDLSFTPKQWENMNRKEFKLTGSWMSYSSPFPGKEWELTAHYFATGQLKFDPGFIYKKTPMSQAQEAFQLYKTPGLVKGKILLVNEEA